MTGVYHVAMLTPGGPGDWSLDIHDYDLLDRDEAIEWINADRQTRRTGTLYRLLELTHDELTEILEDEHDDDDWAE